MCIEKTYFGSFWEEFLVFVGKHNVDKLHSLRVMKKKKIIEYEEEDMVQYEYHVRSQIRHPFLINIVCGFQDYEHLFLLTEQSQNYLVNLIESERRLSTKVTRFYAAEILLAIQYLHSKGLSYGFLSPSNVMIGDDGHVKLRYDFLNGIDAVVGNVEDNLEYASMDRLSDGGVLFVSDYWSIGILIYKMIVGTTPFAASTVDGTISKIKECSPVFPEFFDPDAKDLVSRLLVMTVSDRLGYNEGDADVVRGHPFFCGIDWNKVLEKSIEPPFLFNTTRKDNPSRPAGLRVLYTTDYLPDQKDGYGHTFRDYGTAYSQSEYIQAWKNGFI